MVSGYIKSVNCEQSAIHDIAYLSQLLQNYQYPPNALNYMSQYYGELGNALGLRIIKFRKVTRSYGFLSLSLFISLLKEASMVQEPLDVGTTVKHPPAELDGDEIARTSPMP